LYVIDTYLSKIFWNLDLKSYFVSPLNFTEEVKPIKLNWRTVMNEYILVTVVLLLLFFYIRYLFKYPEDFANYYTRMRLKKQSLEIE